MGLEERVRRGAEHRCLCVGTEEQHEKVEPKREEERLQDKDVDTAVGATEVLMAASGDWRSDAIDGEDDDFAAWTEQLELQTGATAEKGPFFTCPVPGCLEIYNDIGELLGHLKGRRKGAHKVVGREYCMAVDANGLVCQVSCSEHHTLVRHMRGHSRSVYRFHCPRTGCGFTSARRYRVTKHAEDCMWLHES